MKHPGIRVYELLDQIPAALLDKLAEAHSVNHQVKKLSGQLMFKLLLYLTVCTHRGSLNTLMTLFEDVRFRLFAGLDAQFKTRRNSLADRLSSIQVDYFAAILAHLNEQCKPLVAAQGYKGYHIQRFDSTVVSCSSKLLAQGMTLGRKSKAGEQRFKQLKFTIGFNGLGIDQLQVHTQQHYWSEDVALAHAIQQTALDAQSVAVFDRGLKSHQTFADFSLQNRFFVTRINPTQSYLTIEQRTDSVAQQSATLEILEERYIRFTNGVSKKKSTPASRLIIARHLQTQELLYFLTNLFDLPALDITEIYRLRWDIECFFRFLKQELNFTHLLSRSLNGIKVMAYMTMIAALLLLLYRQNNQLQGFKIPKLKFALELQTELIKELIIYCKGDPALLAHFIPT